MPKLVDQLTDEEKDIEATIRELFTEEQMCAYFLTKTIRSQYQFDDEFIAHWYQEIFNKPAEQPEHARKELVQAYTQMLMFENKYRFHLDYWIRQYKDKLVDKMQAFFGGEPGK